MNVRCGDCGSVFRVDPSRVPDAGIRARCSVCGGVIPIGKQGAIGDDFAARLRVTPARVSVVDPEPVVPRQGSAERGAEGSGAPAAALASPAPSPAPSVPDDRVAARAPDRSPPAAAPVRPAATGRPTASTPPVVPRAFTTPPAPPKSATPAAGPATGGWSGAMPVSPRAPTSAARTPPAGVGTIPPRAKEPPPAPNSEDRQAPPRPLGTPPRPAPVSSRPLEPQGDRAPSAGRAPTAGSATAAPAARQASTSEVRRPINPFLANDPNARARRLARALVSDIVTYFPDKHREGLAHHTLPLLFKEEIKKSYEEYREQVGTDFAESTTHFQDALNEILAQGGKVF